jgi:hypothetical protein
LIIEFVGTVPLVGTLVQSTLGDVKSGPGPVWKLELKVIG